MKRYVTLICLITASVFIGSCAKTDADKENEIIQSGINDIKLDPQYNWMVVLPGLGCKGCIQEAEAFMRDYLDRQNILFVLTKVQSLKILQQKIKNSIWGRKNVYIDKDGYFDIPTNNSIYPIIVQIKGGKAVAHQFQSPSNGQAFEWLKAQVE